MSFQGCIVTPDTMIVNLNNKVYSVTPDHPNAKLLREAYREDDAEAFLAAFDIAKSVETYVEGGENKDSGITIVGETVYYNGTPINNAVVKTIQQMLADGFSIKPMCNFLDNYMKCESYNTVKYLWDFIKKLNLTITPDGCFLAYKSVSSDYTDKYTGTVDNTPGQKPRRFKRSEVDDNPNNHCSKGYHVGALSYAGPGGWYNNEGDKVIICKVNPVDVICVPDDHSFAKLRCCYYEPVGEFQGELKSSVYSGEVGDDYSAAPAVVDAEEPEVIEADDLLEGEVYTALYMDRDGKSKTRHFLVDDTNYYSDGSKSYTVELLEPEEYAGEYRTFRVSGLSKVTEYVGLELDDDEDDENKYW